MFLQFLFALMAIELGYTGCVLGAVFFTLLYYTLGKRFWDEIKENISIKR